PPRPPAVPGRGVGRAPPWPVTAGGRWVPPQAAARNSRTTARTRDDAIGYLVIFSSTPHTYPLPTLGEGEYRHRMVTSGSPVGIDVVARSRGEGLHVAALAVRHGDLPGATPAARKSEMPAVR